MNIITVTVGRLKSPQLTDLFSQYQQRLHRRMRVIEIESSCKSKEAQTILASIPDNAFVIALDERGSDVSSQEMANLIEKHQNQSTKNIVFIIGGADGLTDEVLSKANMNISFGTATWPHMLVRVMLIEQIYRAQQILSGHPYHRAS